MKNLLIALLLLPFSLLAQTKEVDLEISHLADNYYIYVTYNTYNGQRISSNGLYLVTKKGVIMIDTPWDTTQFQPLLDSIKTRHNKDVILTVSTHSHDDRTAGLDYYKTKGIKTYATRMTDSLCVVNENARPEYLMDSDTTFKVGKYAFEVYYPGAGHSHDNIVVWFKNDKILYGGCFVKSTEAKGLGYTGESDLDAWPQSIKNVQAKFAAPVYVIPGHDGWENKQSLEHTLKLLAERPK